MWDPFPWVFVQGVRNFAFGWNSSVITEKVKDMKLFSAIPSREAAAWR